MLVHMAHYCRCPSCGEAVLIYDGREFVEERKRTEKLRLSDKKARAMAHLAELGMIRGRIQCSNCGAKFHAKEDDTWFTDAY